MKPAGYYDVHSEYQRRVIDGGARLIGLAAQALDLGPEGDAAAVVDYGAGTGATSVRAVGTALRSIRDRDRDRPVLAIHNDVLRNDYGQLFRNIAAPDGYLEIAGGPIYPAAVAGSFFDRVLPAQAVRLGMCSNAAHWLRGQPSVRIGGGMYFCEAVGDARQTLARRAAEDWLSFLRARADELAGGGRLLVQGIGSTSTGGDEHVSAARLLRVMWETAAGLADDGLLDRARLDDYVFPVYCRTPGELTAPIADGGALAGRLALLTQEVDEVPSPYWEAFERDPDAEAYASAYVEFVRAFAEPTLRAHLFEPAATGMSAAALCDEYFRRLERATAADPAAGRYEAWIVRTVFERPPGDS